jgi:hypothetical protein
MNQLLNDYGILVLIILFIIISLYYKNFINIAIFLILFMGIRVMTNSKVALLYAYSIAVLYGIAKNFHLLENFSNKQNSIKNMLLQRVPGVKKKNKTIHDVAADDTIHDVAADDTIHDVAADDATQDVAADDTIHDVAADDATQDVAANKKRLNKSSKIKKVNDLERGELANKLPSNNAPPIEEIISEDLINKFIRRLKKEDNLLITKDNVNLYKVNPTINKLSKNKLESIKQKLMTDDALVNKPIIITNDFFILDGHHRWYARKNLVENNTNGYNTSGIYNEDIKVVIIDYNIKKCVQKLQEYKIKYNKNYLQKTIGDINNIDKGRKYLDEIKEVIQNLESNYNKFAAIELV